MRRIPIISTIVVTLAVATMIALGLWQLLDRLPRKEAFLVQLATNPAKPVIAFPRDADEALLFRRASAVCPAPTSIRLAGAGASGYRAIAECPPAGDQPALAVQLGTTRDPNAHPRWAGGPVVGHLAHAPTGQSLIGAALDPAPPRLMLVASPPAAGLQPNPAPDVDAVPNNHLAYAGQWFFFAAVAAIIYVLAVARRRR
ncbi:SURF1 family cytochrome oxidase biogenesis protein [Sphingomonas rubra]|uniref:SURF1-like protein n=1 Tax=Sphingomonas rubra TaxID=634430 RepID=A0A1I5T3M1_9SPHN|nr:SURF1 family cytochrome oxidase biogenesis protein [Sphingomonas rubra]SFP77613.1 surfeit locus 1 family protein [Sphingomonas rubra]